MKAVINKAIELASEIAPNEAYEKHMDGLKPEINNLLHKYLPGSITIEQADMLAMVISDMIWNPENYLKLD